MSTLAKRDAIASLLSQGVNKSEIARRLGISRASVRRWADKLDVAEFSKSEPELKDFIESLAPINIALPSRLPTQENDTDVTVVLGDTHFGVECKKTIEVFYQVLDELQPNTVVLNGDTLDMTAVSRYPKDVRYEINLLEERTAYHQFLANVRAILGTTARIIETNANHSGDGVEGRWWKYLSDRLGAVASLPDVLESLSYGKVFIPEWANVELLQDYEMCGGNLFVMHGDVVRKNGGYSARGMLDKWFASIIMNHTHRVGMTAQRIPGIGKRKDQQIICYENGCACDLVPCYATATNWQNSFAIVHEGNESYGIEQVLINNGVATVGILGKTIKA